METKEKSFNLCWKVIYMGQISYFLGANTPKGFYSLMGEMLPPEGVKRGYLLKGGPGCGKSSLMRKVGQGAVERGEKCEFIHCSGDPDSLDGVVLPERGVFLADATAPHVLEPRLPGIVERYVDLGRFYDSAGLARHRGEAEELQRAYQGEYRRAYRCLKGAGQLREDEGELVETEELKRRLRKRARGIIQREVPRGGHGGARRRLLNGMTCKGRVCFWETAAELCPRVYVLADSFGAGHVFLEEVLSAAAERGQERVICLDSMKVERARHVLLPEAGVGFVTVGEEETLPFQPYRRLRVDAMVSHELLRQNKNRVKFSRKVAQALEEDGMETLAKAKALHDQLESLYNPYVNFEGVYETAEKVKKEILEG